MRKRPSQDWREEIVEKGLTEEVVSKGVMSRTF